MLLFSFMVIFFLVFFISFTAFTIISHRDDIYIYLYFLNILLLFFISQGHLLTKLPIQNFFYIKYSSSLYISIGDNKTTFEQEFSTFIHYSVTGFILEKKNKIHLVISYIKCVFSKGNRKKYIMNKIKKNWLNML